ncbi:MAG: hypothetical protein BWX88_00465 [Planctomycetes bacterium ADurb.Bin126]|nr:MAG: hypothetical protein BWX88_00465 [Planctomycetes bacterium ADurb.Bin126]
MSGRAAGFCAGFAVPGHMNPLGGRGMGGWRRGGGGGRGGRGWRNRFCATGVPGWQRAGMGVHPPGAASFAGEQQFDTLKSQAEHLENALADIRKRIEEVQETAADAKGADPHGA